MKPLFTLITISALFILSCDDDTLEIFEPVYVISTQADADSVKVIIGDAIFDIDNPEVGFKGDIEIVNPSGTQNDPIRDLSLFANYKFWLGNIKIESNDITDLSALVNLEQVRDGLTIVNCPNLTSVDLPSMALIANECIITDNPQITFINFGSDADVDVYDDILIDSLVIMNNPELTTWGRGPLPVDLVFHSTIIDNPNLTSLQAFSQLSMPTRAFILEMNSTTVNPTRINPSIDSLTMPRITNINATKPDNDYSWLDRARNRFRLRIDEFTQFNGETFFDTIVVDSIQEFLIEGDIQIDEVCVLKGAIRSTPLEIFSNTLGEAITRDTLDAQCPQ